MAVIVNLQNLAANANGYYDHGSQMHPGAVTGYGQPHHNGHPGYYAPQPQYYPPVYHNQPISHGQGVTHAAFDSKKRGYDALNDFFGDVKRRQIDPTSYDQVGQRLGALQGLSMHGGTIASYMPAPIMADAGGHGAHMMQHQYALPPMENLRTKSDMMNIDQFLEQMQSTVYESSNQAAAAGIQQPGAHYTHHSVGFRNSHSPPHNYTPGSGHATASATHGQQPHLHNTTSSHAATPALTPPSSSLSYTSGQSPASSVPSVPGLSPASRSSSMGYPSLPSVSANYSQHHNAAPTPGLGPSFDNDQRRRYSGGMLQKSANPRDADQMDISEDSTPSPKETTPRAEPAEGPIEGKGPASSHIDPALSGMGSPTMQSDSGDTARDRAEEAWVENIRVIEALRKLISNRLERHEYEDDTEMSGVEGKGDIKQEKKGDEDNLYPVLRAAIDSAV